MGQIQRRMWWEAGRGHGGLYQTLRGNNSQINEDHISLCGAVNAVKVHLNNIQSMFGYNCNA